MSGIEVEQRLVISYKLPSSQKVVNWVPPADKVSQHGGKDFISLGYTGDRGFAQFLGRT